MRPGSLTVVVCCRVRGRIKFDRSVIGCPHPRNAAPEGMTRPTGSSGAFSPSAAKFLDRQASGTRSGHLHLTAIEDNRGWHPPENQREQPVEILPPLGAEKRIAILLERGIGFIPIVLTEHL